MIYDLFYLSFYKDKLNYKKKKKKNWWWRLSKLPFIYNK